jgi:TPR repeat protein
MYAYGRGVQQDFSKATELFRLNSAGGMMNPGTGGESGGGHHAPSMRYLGIFATHGHGYPNGVSDYKAALFWFERCASEDDETASAQCVADGDELRVLVEQAQTNVRETMANFDGEGELIDIEGIL